jgi:hypothetical protein
MVPRLEDVRLDGPVVLFTACVALGSGLLFGLIPAMRASRSDAAEVLKGARGADVSAIGSGVRGALVVAEIALSLVLLIGAGLMVRSFAHLQAVDLGFDEQRLLVASSRLPQSAYPTPASTSVFYGALLEWPVPEAGGDFENRVADVIPVHVASLTDGRWTAPDADTRVVSSGYSMQWELIAARARHFANDGDGARGGDHQRDDGAKALAECRSDWAADSCR